VPKIDTTLQKGIETISVCHKKTQSVDLSLIFCCRKTVENA